MSPRIANVQAFIAKELHSLLFLEEFVFAGSKFAPASSSELEFADAVVLLGDVLLIFQIKERARDGAGNESMERKWFQEKVLKKATKQIRNTLHYLQVNPDIRVANERGHPFNLAAQAYSDILKIVVYLPFPLLPADCKTVRHHVSKTAGLIHIVEASDYLELSRTLRVPEEVVRYFKYRESVLTQFESKCSRLPEAAIAGHFIGGDPSTPPTISSIGNLHQLVQDEAE